MAKKVKEIELHFNNNLNLKLPLKYFCLFNLVDISSSIYCLKGGDMVEVLGAKLFSFVLFKETENDIYKGVFNRIKNGKDITAVKLIYNDETCKQVCVPTLLDKNRRTNTLLQYKTLEDGSLAVCICKNAKEEIERFTNTQCTQEYLEGKRENADFNSEGGLA